MNIPHLTADQIERFRRSDLDTEELMHILHHLDECLQCRGQYLTEPVASAVMMNMEANLLLLAWEGGEHLPDEQIIAFGEGTMEAEEQNAIAFHLERCASCRTQVDRIRVLHGLLMEQQGLVVSPLSRVTLQDTSGSIVLQGNQMRLEGTRKLPAALSGWVSQLLTEGIVTPSRSLNTLLSPLKDLAIPGPSLRNVQVQNVTDSLVAPANTMIRSAHPELRWRSVPDAEEYSVVVMQVTKKNSRLIWKGSMGKHTEGNLPSEVVLETKQLYLWQVTVTTHGIETRSEAAWFSVLPTDTADAIVAIEHQYSGSALILLGAYEQYGLYEDAQAQIHRLMELNVGSALIRDIAQRLERLRSVEPKPASP